MEACFSSPFALFCCPDCNRPPRAATATPPHPSSLQNPRESTRTQGKTPVSLLLLFLVFPCRNRVDPMERNFWFHHVIVLKFLILPRTTAEFPMVDTKLMVMLPSGGNLLPIFPLFSLLSSPCKPSFCPQSLLGSIHCFY